MPDRLCFELRCVLCQPVKKMGIQPTKYPLGILLFFVNAAALCVYKLRFECGGPHGRGREFLGTEPLTVKYFRGCPPAA